MRSKSGSPEFVVGDPSRDDVRIGPVATAAQLADDARRNRAARRGDRSAYGNDGAIEAVGVAKGKGFFVRARAARRQGPADLSTAALHEHEVFGPVATVAPYSGDAAFAAQFVARRRRLLV